VLGTVTVSNGAILAAGGIDASHILFNVEGTGNSVSLSNGSSILTGTYLAPDFNQKITLAPGTVDGAVIGYQIQTSSGPHVYGDPYGAPPAAAPAAAPAAGSVPLPAGAWGGAVALAVGLLAAKRIRGRVRAAV
jgi:hypothetical protein